jgi:poly(A) polymerase
MAGLAPLLSALGAAEGETRFVGGAVRDTLLGLPVKDVDCATRLPPEESSRRIKAAGFKAVPTGIAQGTVTAVIPGGTIEVTTLRRDVETDGRRATAAFTDDWREDAARRDFTINALSVDPLTGAVHDYFDGLADLEAGRVRFIGDPLQRIAEDHLRIMRFFRFQARFGRGGPDAEALAACRARANDLMALSRERIADELIKLLGVADPLATVALMVTQGIFRPVLPEIDAAAVARLDALIGREKLCGIGGDPIRRLGALLPQEPAAAVAIVMRLKMSKAIAKRIEQVAATPDAPWHVLAYRIGGDAAADHLLRGTQPIEAVGAALTALDGWTRPPLPLSGGQLIERGLKAGPAVAATLQAIERRWVEEAFPGPDRVDQIAAEELSATLRSSK